MIFFCDVHLKFLKIKFNYFIFNIWILIQKVFIKNLRGMGIHLGNFDDMGTHFHILHVLYYMLRCSLYHFCNFENSQIILSHRHFRIFSIQSLRSIQPEPLLLKIDKEKISVSSSKILKFEENFIQQFDFWHL